MDVNGDTIVLGNVYSGEATGGVGAAVAACDHDYRNGKDATNGCLYETGSVFVYERSASGWKLAEHIKASPVVNRAEFGASVAIEGDTLIVGAPGEGSDTTGTGGKGAVYIFRRLGGAWQQVERFENEKDSSLTSGEAISRFGSVVRFDGNSLVVSAPRDDSTRAGVSQAGRIPPNCDGSGAATTTCVPGSGAVWAYAYAGGARKFEAFIKAQAPAVGQAFGQSMGISGDLLAVGTGYTQPTVETFVRYGNDWHYAGSVSLPASIDVALEDGHLLVASPSSEEHAVGFGSPSLTCPSTQGVCVEEAGRVDGYWWDGNAWQPAFTLRSPSKGAWHFGSAVVISGNNFFVGGDTADSDGIVWAYE